MSHGSPAGSNPGSPESSNQSDDGEGNTVNDQQTNSASKKKTSNKTSSKPRLTAVQKNTNHKDAENKRRNAIRERFTDLSRLVPGAAGQERSEQVMLAKTAEFLREMIEEQRHLEALADSKGVYVEESKRLTAEDFGGDQWSSGNMDQYETARRKKGLGPYNAVDGTGTADDDG